MTGKRSRWRGRVSVRSGTRRRRRGVSDVVATILLLALTITLFAAVFAFVTSFPSPPAQSNNQFQASLFYPSNGTTKYIAGVHIVHLAGPVVPGSALIYLKSANQPSLGVFQAVYTVSGGLNGASTWNLGQTWTESFPTNQLPLAGGNMTVYIVSQSQLLFSVILPGTSISPPPTIVSTSISPAVPVVGQPFTVYASLAGSYKSNSVYVNLAGVPGGPSKPQLMTQNALGQWTYSFSSGATLNGTYYGYVNATGSVGSGQTAVGAVLIIISAGSSSGATLTLSPTNYIYSKAVTVTLTGAGFTANSTVHIFYNGTVPTLVGCSSGAWTTPNTVVVTATGGFVCTYSIAASTTGSYPITVPFTASDATSGQVVTAYFVRT